MTVTSPHRTNIHRLFAGLSAAAAVIAATLIGATPAAADPPYAKADIDITTCYVLDDPVDYGDGIDWWQLWYIFTNEGYMPTGTFVVETEQVWKAGVSNATTHTFVHESMGPGQSDWRKFWVTRQVALGREWSVWVDTGHDVDESDEYDNGCHYYFNPS